MFKVFKIAIGGFINNDLMSSFSLYPIKYLNDLFVPYDSFFRTNILSTSMSSILNSSLSL